jgi:hypothetical protein
MRSDLACVVPWIWSESGHQVTPKMLSERGVVMLSCQRWALLVAIATSSITLPVSAEEQLVLRGGHYACANASKLNLWDISGDSPLIRYQMTQNNYCWRTMSGLGVRVIQRIGRFVHVEYPGGIDFFVYASDIGPAPKLREKKVLAEKIIERRSVRLHSVENSGAYGVTLIHHMPTVSVTADAGAGLQVKLTIRKDKLQEGFQSEISNQEGEFMQLGGKCNDFPLGLGNGSKFSLKILALDRHTNVAEFEISGIWHRCDSTSRVAYQLLPSKFRLIGKNFEQLVRPHTPQEMMKTT